MNIKLLTQNMFYCIPYPYKCVCSHQNCEATSILSGDITVLRFRRPSWTPSWILERTPVGFTRILDMLFRMVLGMFPEKSALAYVLPLQSDLTSNALQLLSEKNILAVLSGEQGGRWAWSGVYYCLLFLIFIIYKNCTQSI